jgi:hypothetical protein
MGASRGLLRGMLAGAAEGRKRAEESFFFGKKNQKTSAHRRSAGSAGPGSNGKGLFASFSSEKEDSSWP